MPAHQRARNATADPSSLCRSNHYRFALSLAYDGTSYQGFQSQPHGHTIQDVLEARLQRMLRRKVRVLGWGRTDAGVHANGAVCTVDLSQEEVMRFGKKKGELATTVDVKETTTDACLERVATVLCSTFQDVCRDGSIVARKCQSVPRTFDARFSCRWKRYIYTIACSSSSSSKSPMLKRYTWQMAKTVLDFHKMQTTASLLNGRHNFSWLSKVLPGDALDPFRTLELAIEKKTPVLLFFPSSDNMDVYQISAVCDFFLYRMVRRIVGLLVAVGKGQVEPSLVASCLEEHDEGGRVVPRELVYTAPPNGLTLDHIQYDSISM
mmetsp:Transcript_12547/g.18432  ORF Transcript_12547/g.18432 Transcript_12547/m.18432 type:complete len:322 (-) Transcript_12547:194-1159(-)|eukprot:CAMPEP_0194214936 /NCGR_PEP_ID=MMETSP0156-20130528/16375_1 /TAXON_ID=33649 /ORGANISM="Thalassionema nitzschioides, Strain L26-B" /LENGTH=321 /DNA_ID=CAMNT_0038943313 /DNA_START=284 /DNA_END=1249 /DNA_ORIENTATION=+